MTRVEHLYNRATAPYQVKVDTSAYEQILSVSGMPDEQISRLALKFVEKPFLLDAAAIGKSIIVISTSEAWKTYVDDNQKGNSELTFKLLHESKHSIDFQKRSAVMVRLLYWVAIPQLIYISTQKTLDAISPTNPYNQLLGISLTSAALPLMYKLDPYEIRANNFAESKISDPDCGGIVKFVPIKPDISKIGTK